MSSVEKLKLDRETLGHLAQKHESLAGHPIEERLSAEINRAVRGVLSEFLVEIRANLDVFVMESVDLQEYDDWAHASHSLLEHSPSSLREIFSVSEARNVDYIWSHVKESQTEIGNFLTNAYDSAEGETKKEKAKNAMSAFQINADRFVGKNLSDVDFESLRMFQDMVERFESVENIREINNHPKIKEVLELVMSIQKFLCEILDRKRVNDPEWFSDNEAVFGELALFDGDKVVPSSRFLKLILHNIGEFVLMEDESLPAIDILRNAFQRAINHHVFQQKICIFSTTSDGGMVFEAVKDKVCPASGFLATLVLQELSKIKSPQ